MAISTRLELFCRLFLGLFVGFFCVTTALFVRYKLAHQLPPVTVVQLNGASHAAPGGAAAMPVSRAARSRRATPLLDRGTSVLIASSSSTVVTFIAALVVNLLNWRRSRRRGRPGKIGRQQADPGPRETRKRA
ncbi:MAG: hypothetical protein LBV73_02860 [Paraburkholderia sp.]|nr:hypothetical protein [Paraburkholderia sp.]